MTNQQLEKKRQKEIKVVHEMIAMYCHSHHQKKGLCQQCQSLYEYAKSRSEHCPFMENKNFCSKCKVHCYKPDMQARIRQVMRYSGPRMIFHHPLLALWHVITSQKEKHNKKTEA